MEMTMEAFDFLIVGAGPAGIAAALEVKKAGVSRLLLLEKGPSHSQMIRTYYKEAKRVDARYAGFEAICFGQLCLRDGDRESYLNFMDQVIRENELPVRYNSEIWSVKKTGEEFSIEIAGSEEILRAKTVILAIGKMGRPNTPDYWKEIPANLKRNQSIVFDINSRNMDGLNVLVVGGGDSACEYVQMLATKSKVTLSYRKPKITRANERNRRLTQELIDAGKVRAHFNSQINKIEDLDGRPHLHFLDGTAETYDLVLYGLGGQNPVEFLRNTGVELSEKGEAIVSEIKESSVRGLFIVGDLLGKVQGGGSIISGFNSSAAAVRAVLKRDHAKVLSPEFVSLDHLAFGKK